MADQLKYSATPMGGNGLLALPTWQRLAEQGVCFDQAYSTSPICTPSRTSMMTGTDPLVHQVYCHQNHAPENLLQLPQLLQQAGYTTLGVGHYESNRSLDRGWSDAVDEKGSEPLVRALASQYQAGSREVGYSSGEHALPGEQSHAAVLTDQAITMVDRHGGGRDPLFLHVAYIEPHAPYFAPQGWSRVVDPNRIPLPPRHEGADRPAWQGRAQQDYATAQASEQDFRAVLAAYYGMAAYLDTQMGRLLEALEQRGILEDAWVILASDHGDYTGEKGLFTKTETPYEALLHVPLVIRGPGGAWQAGRRVEQLVSLSDLFATVIALGDQDLPDDSQSSDLVGWLERGPTRPLHEAVFSAVGEYHGHLKTTMPWGLPEAGRHLSLVRGVRNRRYSYIRDPDYGDEAYDLQADPYELHNLVQQQGALPHGVRELMRRLDDHEQQCAAIRQRRKVIAGDRNFGEPLNRRITGGHGSAGGSGRASRSAGR